MPDDLARWLTEHARPLDALEPGTPHGDLGPLGDALRGVRIVGLGESTHGTHEFFRLKHRLVEFLVREEGFTVLAMEASASAARALDTYVRHGTGDPARLIGRLGFWTWRTAEMLDLVEWLRAHNEGLPEERRVRFVGTDPQRCADSVAAVTAFLDRAAPERAAQVRDLTVLAQARPASRPDLRQTLVPRAEALADFIAGHRQTCAERIAAAGEDGGRKPAATVDDALEHARILVRAADLVTRSPGRPTGEDSVFAVRDRYMADAVARLVDTNPRARVIVWAHNGHIAKGTYGAGVPALGSRLRARYGDAYYALALLFGKGSFLARRGTDVHGPPLRHRIGTGTRTVEARFAQAVPGDFYVGLTTGGSPPEAARWLRSALAQRSFGANVPRFAYRFHVAPLVPAEDYDGIAFVARSTCSRVLPVAER
ncbi:erythromycin esterase family protein [Streptomyces albofaciens JCM 4342]|uniref:erythromycin esterase family protein n=1 Tax=Streptomyces albofaciens TaxID=66866 RepID=UPI001238F1B1|nr:erythromycin esterase family protein [Streptomyces albofaciens]KAA6213383.1 erythromycin esterase family protein [Streptomyces albofaciens JCM 4342]